MTQKQKAFQERESDLQPVYDALTALHPDQVRSAFRNLSRTTRYILVITVAGAVLLWSMLTLVRMIAHHVQTTTGPFLLEALQAPYQLDSRPLPTTYEGLLPATVGNFTQVAGTNFIVVPQQGEADEAATIAAPAEPVSGCMFTATATDITTACVPHSTLHLTFADYQNAEGAITQMMAGQFANHEEATTVTKALSQQASLSGGRIGNYALGITPVDYFYASNAQDYIFVWSHDAWVYIVSSADSRSLESVINAFPY